MSNCNSCMSALTWKPSISSWGSESTPEPPWLLLNTELVTSIWLKEFVCTALNVDAFRCLLLFTFLPTISQTTATAYKQFCDLCNAQAVWPTQRCNDGIVRYRKKLVYHYFLWRGRVAQGARAGMGYSSSWIYMRRANYCQSSFHWDEYDQLLNVYSHLHYNLKKDRKCN